MLRLGLCCLFRQAPIKFRITTTTVLKKHGRTGPLSRVDQLCLENSSTLITALDEVQRLGIGAFRVMSQFFAKSEIPSLAIDLFPGIKPENQRLCLNDTP